MKRIAFALMALLSCGLPQAQSSLTFNGTSSYYSVSAVPAGFDDAAFSLMCLQHTTNTTTLAENVTFSLNDSSTGNSFASIRSRYAAGNRDWSFLAINDSGTTGTATTTATADPNDWSYVNVTSNSITSRTVERTPYPTGSSPTTASNSTSFSASSSFSSNFDTMTVGRFSDSTPSGYYGGDVCWCLIMSLNNAAIAGTGDAGSALLSGKAPEVALAHYADASRGLSGLWYFWFESATIQDRSGNDNDLGRGAAAAESSDAPKPMYWTRGGQ